MIEVKHDAMKLPSRVFIKVADAKIVESFLAEYCKAKRDRGYTLRFVADYQTNIIELAHRQSLNVQMALRAVKDHGYRPKVFTGFNDFIKRLY
jgi:hypothetical protein